MINLEKAPQNERQFLSLTGYTIDEFLALVPYFEEHFIKHMTSYTFEGLKRLNRKYIPYKNSPLPTIEVKLYFILMYLKQNPTQQHHAKMFGMDQFKTNKWIHLLHTVLNITLKDLGPLPSRTGDEIEIFFNSEDAQEYWHDGTERPIERPSDSETEKDHYSGKKKRHTVKNLLLIDMFCRIIYLSATFAGTVHDKKIADQANYNLPEGSVLNQDKGFQGFNLEGVIIQQPKKKPRGGELTPEEKKENSRLSSIRIRVEHVICGVKRYRIIKEKMRVWRADFRDKVMETCCGLHNFRLHFRPWNYAN